MTSSSNPHGYGEKNMVNNYYRTNGRVMNTLITEKPSQSIHITSTGQAQNTKVK